MIHEAAEGALLKSDFFFVVGLDERKETVVAEAG